jgi:transposase
MVLEVQEPDRNHVPICPSHGAGTEAHPTQKGFSLPSGSSLHARRVPHSPTGEPDVVSVQFVGRQKSRFALPPAPPGSPLWQQWDAALDLDHPARIIDAFVNGLDRTSLLASYLGVGSQAHNPDLMLKIVLYETHQGRLSPAQWARDVRDSDALRWLGQGIKPSRSALYGFRDRLSQPIFELHADAIRQAIAEGLTPAEKAVLDGTSVRSCGSRHHLVNKDKLTKRLLELNAAVAQDVAGQPIESQPYWMAETPSGRQAQLERYRLAGVELDDRLAENQERPKDKQLPREKVKVSVTDPEAPLGRDKEKVFCPMYTAQFVVDTASLLILSFDVFAQATDAGTLAPMLDRTQEVTGTMVIQIGTDAGYVSLLDLQECQERNVRLIGPVGENNFTEQKRAEAGPPRIGKDQFQWLPDDKTYRCPEGHRLDYKGKEQKRRRGDNEVTQHRFHCPAEYCRACPLRERCVQDPEKGRTVKRLEGEEIIEAHKEWMKTEEAKAANRLRGSVIERCFGDAKRHRNLRCFHGRGLKRAKAEIGLVILVQTALNLARLRKNAVNPRENAA